MASQSRPVDNLKSLYTLGGTAAFLQLATLFAMSIAMAVLGPKPAGPADYFAVQESSKLAVILRGDFLTLILIGLYLGTFPALYTALRRTSPVYTALATLFTIIAVTGSFSTESTFSLLHLGDQYAAATSEAVRGQLLAASEAVIAQDLWNSTAGYMGGILLQGAGVMISIIMLRTKTFSKKTAYSGMLGNALDLVQHLLHPFLPAVSAPIQMVMGIFYILWFPMLRRDLLRLAREADDNAV
jgi:hypothetical protein